MVRVSIGGKAGMQGVLEISSEAFVFIPFGIDNCTLKKLLKMARVIHKLAWACTGP